jgi:protein-tyrosine phosphatase
MIVRTSESDPIRVDFLAAEALPGPGRLGMTFAPGKKAHGIAGRWERDLDADLERLIREYGAQVLVPLLRPHEYEMLAIEDLPTRALKHGFMVREFPIPDVGVPRSITEAAVLVQEILEHVRAGRTVVVHCRGGLGRTGLIAACCLTSLGHEAEQAMAMVRDARPETIETQEQEEFVRRFSMEWRAQPKRDRIRGCLLGGALGDALGYPVEFIGSWKKIVEAYGPHAPERLAYAGAPAVITDDTQMTVFVAEGFIRAVQRYNDRGICNPASVIRNALLRWYATQVPGATLSKGQNGGWLIREARLHHRRAPGNTNLSALKAQWEAGSLPDVQNPPNDSKGCGAIMRSAPIGLGCRNATTAFEMARDAAVITHGHPSMAPRVCHRAGWKNSSWGTS